MSKKLKAEKVQNITSEEEYTVTPSHKDIVLNLLKSRGARGISVRDFPAGFRLSSVIHRLRNEHNITTSNRGKTIGFYELTAHTVKPEAEKPKGKVSAKS